MHKGRVKSTFFDPHLRSGPMNLLLDYCPRARSTLMDVCLHSFSSSLVILISIPALPAVDYFLQSNLIYIGDDAGAFGSKYPAPVTRVVSLGSLTCYALADLFPRRSNSSNSELLNLASAMDTDYLKYIPPDPPLIILLLPLSLLG